MCVGPGSLGLVGGVSGERVLSALPGSYLFHILESCPQCPELYLSNLDVPCCRASPFHLVLCFRGLDKDTSETTNNKVTEMTKRSWGDKSKTL